MKILLVFTGGTIGSIRVNGSISPDENNSALLIDMYRKSGKSAEFEVEQPYNILSETLSADYLNSLYDCLCSHNISDFDGVIVACGTDTLQYVCSFLSYKLGLCGVPVVVVSANYPLPDKRSNGLNNFCAAVDFIASGEGRGVFASYQNGTEPVKIHRASRLLPHNAYSDNLFDIFNSTYGEISNGIFIRNSEYYEYEDDTKFLSEQNLSQKSDVVYIVPYVGMSYPKINRDTKAILLGTYHSGTINTSDEALKQFCNAAKDYKIPLFLTGESSGFEYESKSQYANLGITPLPPASPVAIYVKLWLLPKDKIDSVLLPFGGDFYKI